MFISGIIPKLHRNAPVAQLDRVRGYEPRDRGFESLQACQITRSVKRCCGLFALLYHKIVLDCPFELPEVHRCVALDP